jgi:hypothetical protein
MGGSSLKGRSRRQWMREELDMAFCNACNIWRQADRFFRSTKVAGGLRTQCKECENARLTSPASCGTAGWTKRQAAYLWTHYRMLPLQWEEMFTAQGGNCYICGVPALGQSAVDHDHSCCPGPTTCGSCVIGIACRNCNTLEGSLQSLVVRGGTESLIRLLRRSLKDVTVLVPDREEARSGQGQGSREEGG